jgi:hypothetical protein
MPAIGEATQSSLAPCMTARRVKSELSSMGHLP